MLLILKCDLSELEICSVSHLLSAKPLVCERGNRFEGPLTLAKHQIRFGGKLGTSVGRLGSKPDDP